MNQGIPTHSEHTIYKHLYLTAFIFSETFSFQFLFSPSLSSFFTLVHSSRFSNFYTFRKSKWEGARKRERERIGSVGESLSLVPWGKSRNISTKRKFIYLIFLKSSTFARPFFLSSLFSFFCVSFVINISGTTLFCIFKEVGIKKDSARDFSFMQFPA